MHIFTIFYYIFDNYILFMLDKQQESNTQVKKITRTVRIETNKQLIEA